MSENGSSQGSGASGVSSGDASSVASDAAALNRLNDANGDESLDDLLEQNKGLQEMVFACLHTVNRNKQQTPLWLACLRVVLEFLQMFRVIFNTSFPVWRINKGIFIWKAVYWVLFRFLVWDKGYSSYVSVFYVIASVVLLVTTLTVFAAWMLKKEDNAQKWWMKRLLSFLQLSAFVLFSLFWTSLLDYMLYLLDCKWQDEVPHHMLWEDVSCLEMPHLGNMIFAGVMCIVLMAITLLLSVSDADLNPMTRNIMASPNANTSITLLALKMVMVIVSTAFDTLPDVQASLMIICAGCITYLLLRRAVYYCDWLNHIWVGLWCGLLFVCGLLVEGWHGGHEGQEAYLVNLTWGVLYGIFGVVAVGMLLSWLHLNKWLRRPAAHLIAAFKDPESCNQLKTVYRFKAPEQVELLARTMRRWDEDGTPEPDAANLGAFVINCGLARYPNSSEILIRYANFLLSAKKDGQAARTQLQLAAQSSPSWLQRYFIYVSQEYAKKVKSLTEGIDLMGFIEFKRNYRACVKAHKMALMAQRRFWKVSLRDTVSYKDMQDVLQHLHQAEQQAQQVYKRVLERYPGNGKLLKIYGRFQEFVCNDPWTAGSYYAEAMKQGLNDNLMGLVNGTAGQDSSDKMLQVMGGDVNEKTDGIIIIDARGTMLIANPAASNMFGYAKGELEGKNVSILMPQPFSSSHDMFLDNYVKTGQPKILNTRREIVAITKEHMIFPISLCVTKLSGAGLDAIFFGLVKPMQRQDTNTVKVWTTAAGTVLCVDANFTDWFGVNSEDVLGKPFSSICTHPEAVDRYTQACTKLPPEQIDGGKHSIVTQMLHKYTEEVDVHIGVQLGGTVDQRLLVFQIRCLSDPTPLFVTDAKATIIHVNAKFAGFVGYSVKSLVGMSLGALVPSPVCRLLRVCLKAAWVAVPPPLSCRSGAVVFFLHANNTRVPATLQLSSTTAGGHKRHIVKVNPSSREAQQDQQRLLLHVNQHGVVLSTNASASRALFGFEPSELVGRPVAAAVNVFAQWRKRFGEDASLLAMLCVKATEASGHVIVRVGVHRPVPDEDIIKSSDAGSQKGGNQDDILKVLQLHGRREHPAILTVQPAIPSDASGGLDMDSLCDNTPVLQLELWRPHMLSGVIDIDEKMLITDADAKAGMMFGMHARSLLQSSVFSLLGRSSSLTACDLLCGNINGNSNQGQKSMLKQGGASRVGPARMIEAPHADGGIVKVEIQAVCKESNSSRQLQVLLRAKDDYTGSLKPLLALAGKAEEMAVTAAVTHDRKTVEAACDVALSCPRRPKPVEGEDAAIEDGASDAASGHDSEGSGDMHTSHKAMKRTAAWVTRQAVVPDECPRSEEDADAVMVEAAQKTGSNGGGLHKAVKVAESQQPHAARPVTIEAPHRQQSGSVHSESEAGDAASSASGAGQDDELVPDYRRAKRLKKLVRLMTSHTAHTATESFRKTTWLVVLGLTLVHVLCFLILTTQIQARYENAYAVDAMATVADRSQLTTLRTVLLQQCFRPSFGNMQACTASAIQSNKDLLYTNVQISKYNHQGLYLGFTSLQPFKDPRLMTYWTNTGLEEKSHLFRLDNGTDVFRTAQTPLWQLGNKYVGAGHDIYFWSIQLKDLLSATHSYQYIMENGPTSIFTGYSWSLDVLVDYAWQQLGTLETVILILVVLEVVVVQLACLLWEFVVLKLANNQAMRRFSIFLALPSATVRIMASQACQHSSRHHCHQVEDDDSKSDADDDDLDIALIGGEQAQEQQGNKSSTVRKSVRLFVGEDEEEVKPSAAEPGRGEKLVPAHDRRTMVKDNSSRAPLGLLHKVYKQTLARLNITIKVNGKRMATNNSIVWRLMVPLVVWMLAVVVFSAVSLQQLSGLQGPLASLNVAAHTMYRTGRVRSLLSLFAFEEDRDHIEEYRRSLQAEVDLLRKEYSILLYGGHVDRVADVAFDGMSPVGVFENQKAAFLLFMTRNCLRQDQSGCYAQTSQYYDVTHSGLDAVMNRYMENVDAFAKLPSTLAWPNHTLYLDSTAIATHDMYDGMKTLQALFVNYTIDRLEQVKVLHVILLVGLIVLAASYVLFMFLPYVRKLHVDAKVIAGLLSLLPAETGVEGVIKSVFLASANGTRTLPASQDGTAAELPTANGSCKDSHAIGIGQAGYWEPHGPLQPAMPDDEVAYGRRAKLQLS